MKNTNINVLTLIGVLILTAILATTACKDKVAESRKKVREANVLLYQSRFDEARELFEKATNLDPENPEAWYGLGLTWMNRQRYEKAIEHFSHAIELKQDYTDAFYNRGQAWFYMGELYKACDNWTKAWELGKPNMEDKLKKCD